MPTPSVEIRGAERYQPDKLPQLEKNVEEQVINAAGYSLSVNLAVLRLYQLQPADAKKDIIAKILLKALMQLPKSDYKICIQVLPERLQVEEPVSSIVLLAQHLENNRLQDFWAITGSCRDTLNSVPGFYDAVRSYILHSIGISCQTVTRKVLADSLQMEGQSLDNLLAEQSKKAGWKSGKGAGGVDVVVLPKNAYNTAAPKHSQGSIPFEAVAPALWGLAAAH